MAASPTFYKTIITIILLLLLLLLRFTGMMELWRCSKILGPRLHHQLCWQARRWATTNRCQQTLLPTHKAVPTWIVKRTAEHCPSTPSRALAPPFFLNIYIIYSLPRAPFLLCVRARASLHGTFKAVDLLYIWVYNSYTDSSVSLLFAFSFFFGTLSFFFIYPSSFSLFIYHLFYHLYQY